jgi:hypothetical protein
MPSVCSSVVVEFVKGKAAALLEAVGGIAAFLKAGIPIVQSSESPTNTITVS